MPREIAAWNGKPLAPPSVPVVAHPPAPSVQVTNRDRDTHGMQCPQCACGELRALASGGLGCSSCGTVFQSQVSAPPRELAPEPEAALDQIDAINAMLRRNALVLGPGGVPLAESREQNRGNRRRATSRRMR